MKILTKRQEKILDEMISDRDDEIKDLKVRLDKANDFKAILEKLTDKTLNNSVTLNSISYMNAITGSPQLNISDNVLVYVDDILGGKVIKQEGIKCLVLNKDGDVKTGLTKQPADKGYSYKLVRGCA